MIAWASPCGCTGYVMRTTSADVKLVVFCRRHSDQAAAARATGGDEGGDVMEEEGSKIAAALGVAAQYSQIDGGHHKAWVIDQMVRALTGDDYAEWVRIY